MREGRNHIRLATPLEKHPRILCPPLNAVISRILATSTPDRPGRDTLRRQCIVYTILFSSLSLSLPFVGQPKHVPS